jgi:hypothetical protein
MPALDVRRSGARAGFAAHGDWCDPPAFAIVQRGEATLGRRLRRTGGVGLCRGGPAGRGEIRETEICGMRDFGLTDPDGNRVGVGRSLCPGPGLGEDRELG